MYISKEKSSLETIHSIRALQKWSWPTDGKNERFILGRPLPGIGDWKKWSPAQIEKISKNRNFEKPDPICSTHTQSTKSWTMPIIGIFSSKYLFIITCCNLLEIYFIRN
jgi:hypothetical protein